MTLQVLIGRRVAKNWLKRTTNRIGGLVTFKENLWIMIKQAMQLAQRKCNDSKKGKWVMTKTIESEDLHYNIEWLKIMVQGSEEFEKEEYEEALKFYQPFNKLFKKDFNVDSRMKQHFKTKMLSKVKLEEAYKKGYGAVHDNNLANKLLEMGILTHIEWIKDFDLRKDDIQPDF